MCLYTSIVLHYVNRLCLQTFFVCALPLSTSKPVYKYKTSNLPVWFTLWSMMHFLIMRVFIFLLALPVVTLCYTVDQRLIYVDSSQTGVNDSSCWEGGYSTPCLSLNLALKGAQHYNHSITILLQPGQHQLHSGSETQLRNMSQLAIVGNGSEGEPVVITCQPLAGLAFLWSTNITMNNLSLIGCGKLQNNKCHPNSSGNILYWLHFYRIAQSSC